MCCKRELHFFDGAMGVFTSQTLLGSVGVSKHKATLGAVAINWILKRKLNKRPAKQLPTKDQGSNALCDVACERMVHVGLENCFFLGEGKKFDYDLKQLLFASDLLMELSAGVELATTVVPHLFLPLACAANVAKNVGAVTSTSTRTPIYKAFAKGENIGMLLQRENVLAMLPIWDAPQERATEDPDSICIYSREPISAAVATPGSHPQLHQPP
ncbi:Protein root UVB sensitive 6 [Camellia lanceoleosa]|uniref:Protein root UVB sensitive 6 n=1 Tax=Camellia lanceoleosa TaxID=1840588 RepID=A0ACC0HSA3_9ERIC|nr:Protein root UVB sensitive 6 [Camellia lanceoleosa]